MPYTVRIDQFLDFTSSINWPAVVGGIWVPPPANGSNPGTPTFTGTVTTTAGLPPVLTFAALGGPPTTDSVMLISQSPQTWREGSIRRSHQRSLKYWQSLPLRSSYRHRQ